MLFSTLFTASLLGAAIAAPSGKGGKGGKVQSKYVLANFDDLQGAITAGPPVGIYKYLKYDGFSVTQATVAGIEVLGVRPKSYPNVATAGTINLNVTTGANSTDLPDIDVRGLVTADPPTYLPSISSNYTGSKVKYFDLKQFYFGCVLATTNTDAAATPQSCNLDVVGYNSYGDAVANQTFTFTEQLPGPQDPILAKLNDKFKGLTDVTFDAYAVTNGDTDPTLVTDDFSYTVYLQGGKKATYPSKGHGGKSGE